MLKVFNFMRSYLSIAVMTKNFRDLPFFNFLFFFFKYSQDQNASEPVNFLPLLLLSDSSPT